MASNPYKNKIVYNGTTLLDLTSDDVTVADVAAGKKFHLPSGQQATGTATAGSVVITDTQDSHGGTIREITSQEVVYLQNSKSVTPTETAQIVQPDSGYDALASVNVGAIPSTYVGSGITSRNSSDLSASGATVTVPAGYYSSQATKSISNGSATTPATTITTNPTVSINSSGLVTATASATKSITPTVSAGYVSSGSAGTVTASGSSTLQLTTQAAATVTPNESVQTAVASGKYTTGNVKVAAIPSTYVGSGITQRTSSNLTVSGSTVTAPAGYYSAAATKSVATMTLPTSAATSATSGYTSKATIGRSTSDQYINIPTGYNTAGAYYKVSAVANGSATTPATTITTNPTISVNSSTGVITATNSKTQSVTPTVSAGYVSSGTAGTITVSGSNTSNLSTQSGKTVTPTESEQTAVAAGKYTLGAVKVGAISSTYVGSGITQRSSTDLSASGATVTVPSGYYASQATKSVTSGTAGTPTATKGTVSNHSVSVTPSVTNTTGYITGDTKTGTAVTVSASELVSGTKSISENGTGIDVTNYASVDVAVPSSEPSLRDKTITASKKTQVVYDDDAYGASVNESSPANTHSAPSQAVSSASINGTALTYGDEYRIIGKVYVQNSSGQIIEYYNLDGSFIWEDTYTRILENNSTKYLSYVEISRKDATTAYFNYGCQFAGTYGFIIKADIYEESGYDGLNSVTVNPYPISLTTKTVIPSGETQVVYANTRYGILDNVKRSAVSQPMNYNFAYTITETSGLTTDTQYHLTGRFSVIDSNEDVLEYYDIDEVITWNTTKQTIFFDDTYSSYFESVNIYKGSSSTQCYLSTKGYKSGTYGYIANLVFSETPGYDGLESVTVNPYSINLTTKTVTPNDYVQHVIANNNQICFLYVSVNASDRTASNAFSSVSCKFDPQTTLTLNNNYYIFGKIDVIDENNQVLETYNVNKTIPWKSNSGTDAAIIENDENAYYAEIRLYNNSNSSNDCYLAFKHQKTAKYGLKTELEIYESSSTNYDGLSSVTVNPVPNTYYSPDLIKQLIQRDNTLKTLTFPEGITTIGYYALSSMTGLNMTSLPNTITSIQHYAFNGCTNLALTSLPSGITSIGNYAFQNCSKITLTSLPSGITKINDYTFYSCTLLALSSLPNGITSIGIYAFGMCVNITLSSLPSSLTSIGNSAFYQCTNITLSSLPSSLTSIGNSAFTRCTGITSISCDGIITTLGSGAFNGASGYSMQLTSARFPYMALTSSIGTVFGYSTAANACQLLEIVDIGTTTGIAANAFANCYALQTLILRKTTVCTLSATSAFTNTPMNGYNSLTGTVYVPSALINSYKTATNWSTLYNNGTVTFTAIEGSQYELS